MDYTWLTVMDSILIISNIFDLIFLVFKFVLNNFYNFNSTFFVTHKV